LATGWKSLSALGAGNETDVRRKEMWIAMSNALALVCWHYFRFFNDFSSRDFVWLLIGVFLAVVVMWVLSRRRRRWF
jgi:hypothetical protein